jgi:hypothetical protein
MLATVAIVVCIACVKICLMLRKRAHDESGATPSVGLNGAMVEPRR